MQRDSAVVRDFFARVSRRLTWLAAARGAALGLGVAIVLALLGWRRHDSLTAVIAAGVVVAITGTLVSVSLAAPQRRRVATIIEPRAPESRNLLVTAAELFTRQSDEYVRSLVFGRAARLVERLDPSVLFPARNVALALVAALAAWMLTLARPALSIPDALRGPASQGMPSLEAIDVTVTPPAYIGRAPKTFRDPSRIEAIAGSEISLSVRARADRVLLEALSSKDTMVHRGRDFTGKIVADADGFLALQPIANERAGERRLIGLTVLPDSLPRVRIAAPGRDQRLPNGRATLDIAIGASDDFGLATLALRYTKVSGSGERFTFAEGQVPLSVAKRDARGWTARAKWVLDSLDLAPGDMVVYRAVATDRRTAGGAAESDSYIAEVLAPGGVAAPGFAVDPEQERYAVSQQMVILKTERLIARRASMSSQDFADESQQIAAEQRKVRAEFVFMLGGELADDPELAASMTEINEEEEAARESDILEGRNANAGHVALLRAIRAMSRASTSLTAADPSTALPRERTALQQLERAFSHSRILLRALTTRERLDPTRRLTGALAEAVGDVGPRVEASASPLVATLRRTLAGVATTAASRTFDARRAAEMSSLAERVLRLDPSSRTLHDISAELSSAAKASAENRTDDARAALDRASSGIVGMLRRELPEAPRRVPTIGESRMNGALVDALRSGRQR